MLSWLGTIPRPLLITFTLSLLVISCWILFKFVYIWSFRKPSNPISVMSSVSDVPTEPQVELTVSSRSECLNCEHDEEADNED